MAGGHADRRRGWPWCRALESSDEASQSTGDPPAPSLRDARAFACASEGAMSDSDSEDDVPLAQRVKKAETPAKAAENSDSEDDVPLAQRAR